MTNSCAAALIALIIIAGMAMVSCSSLVKQEDQDINVEILAEDCTKLEFKGFRSEGSSKDEKKPELNLKLK